MRRNASSRRPSREDEKCWAKAPASGAGDAQACAIGRPTPRAGGKRPSGRSQAPPKGSGVGRGRRQRSNREAGSETVKPLRRALARLQLVTKKNQIA